MLPRLIGRLESIAINLLCTGLVLAIMFLVLAETFSRGVLASSIYWSTDVLVYMLLWTIFLGAALSSRDREHIAFNGIIDRLPAGLSIIAYAAQRVFSIIFITSALYSMALFLVTLSVSWLPTLHVAQSYFVMPCVAFLVLYLCYELKQLINLFRARATI